MNQILEDKVSEKEKKKADKKGLWGRAWKKRKLEKPNMVAVIYLREDGMAEPLEIKTRRGFFNVNNHTYHVDKDCIYTLTKDRVPLAVIREWSVTPIGKKEWDDKPIQEIMSKVQDHVMNGIIHSERVRSGEDRGDGKITSKQIILGGIILVILVAVVMGYF